jgi:hypothetical protein
LSLSKRGTPLALKTTTKENFMNTFTRLALALTLALGITAAPRLSSAAPQSSPRIKAEKPDMQRVATHLREHVKYPATRQEILDACAQTTEFSAGEKAWAAAHLPEGTYASPAEVLKALGK